MAKKSPFFLLYFCPICSDAKHTAASDVITCTSSTAIAASGSSVFSFTVNVDTDASGTQDNLAQVGGGGDPTNPNAPDNTTAGQCTGTDTPNEGCAVDSDTVAGINITKTISNITFEAPQYIRIFYSLLVENTGSTTLSNVQVTDDLATTFALADSFTVETLSSVTLTTNVNFDGDTDSGLNPGHINMLDGTDSLATGASGTILLEVRVDTGGNSDVYTNEATATGSPPTGPDVQDTDSIAGPSFIDPAVSKSANPFQASVGETVTFTIDVFNNGTVAASNVVVTDVLPDIFDYVTATSIDTATSLPRGTISLISPRTVQVDIGNLDITDVIRITIVTEVNALGQPPIVNEAVVTADPPPNGVFPDPIQNNTSAVNIETVTSSDISEVSELPGTGFAPDVITVLPQQSAEQAYSDLGDLWIEIPSLDVKMPIAGVPLVDESWNVDWLWNQVGWLHGTAYPTLEGNSLLTGHVYLPNGLPGPFVDLSKLRWGSQIIVHAFGDSYIYQVRTNRVLSPDDMSVLQHEDQSWLTLLTCKGYDEASGDYSYRIAVRAVLMKVNP